MSNEYKDWKHDKIEEAQWWVAKYPFLRITNNAICPWHKADVIESHWLDELPEGWTYTFGEEMCDKIIEALGKYIDRWHIIQVKEKFGEMCIYSYWDTDGLSDEAVDELKLVRRKVENIINEYTIVSFKTCIVCGAPADVRTVKGYVAPYCISCYKKRYLNNE